MIKVMTDVLVGTRKSFGMPGHNYIAVSEISPVMWTVGDTAEEAKQAFREAYESMIVELFHSEINFIEKHND